MNTDGKPLVLALCKVEPNMANPKFVIVCVMAMTMVYVVVGWEPARATFYGGSNGEETLRMSFFFYKFV